VTRYASLLCLVLMLVACSGDSELKAFTSDGCSLFPDASLIDEADWCRCCYVHDIAYWKGGTAAEREAADRALQRCIAEVTGDETLAFMMYEGVKFGGSPYFYNWYRWGYGWDYERKYQALTPAEQEQASTLLAEAEQGNPDAVCER